MQGGQGVLPAFGVGFTPHIQRQARTDLRVGPHAVDALVHLAIAPVASLHRIGHGGQSLVIEQREGLVQRRGKAFLQGLPHLGESLEPTPQCGECAQRGLGPTAPIAERIPLVHHGSERVSLGEPTADAPQGLACGCVQVPLDKQIPMGEQRGAWRFQPPCGASGLCGRPCTRTAPGQWGLRRRQALALAGHRLHHRCDDLLDDMTLAQLMGAPAKDLGEGGGLEGRTIGGDAPQCQVTGDQGGFQPPQKGPDVVVGGSMGSDAREETLITARSDRREHRSCTSPLRINIPGASRGTTWHSCAQGRAVPAGQGGGGPRVAQGGARCTARCTHPFPER
jgi:hypothetical protein